MISKSVTYTIKLSSGEFNATYEELREIVRQVSTRIGSPKNRHEQIMDAVCDYHGIHRRELETFMRSERLSHIRFMCYKLLRESGLSLNEVSEFMPRGGKKRDHATVMHGLSRHNDLMKMDKVYRKGFEDIKSMVENFLK